MKVVKKCFQRAIDQGNINAFSNLGLLYERGLGIDKDESDAFLWFMRGADLGDPTGQCYVAHCYYYGIGVAKNETKAKHWYQLAFDQNDSTTNNLERMKGLKEKFPDIKFVPIETSMRYVYEWRYTPKLDITPIQIPKKFTKNKKIK